MKQIKALQIYDVCDTILGIICMMDICDIPCVNFLDNTMPINLLGWTMMFALSISVQHFLTVDKQNLFTKE